MIGEIDGSVAVVVILRPVDRGVDVGLWDGLQGHPERASAADSEFGTERVGQFELTVVGRAVVAAVGVDVAPRCTARRHRP